MDTKQYLGQIRKFDKQIQNKLIEIYQLRTMAENITVATDKERVDSSSNKDKLGCIITKVVDMEKEIDKIIDNRCNIVKQIESLEDMESYDILAKVYILGQDLKVIAIDKKISYRHFSRIYGKAINDFEKKYKKTYEMS